MTFPKGYKPPTTNSSTNPSKNYNNNNLPLFHQLNNKGIQFLNLGKYNEAISFFQKSLELNPIDSNVWFNLGVAFEKLSLFDKALSFLNTSVQINSNNHLALNEIGIIYYNSGKFKESIRYFEKALEINPNNATFLQNKKAARDMHWKKRIFRGIEVLSILSGTRPSPTTPSPTTPSPTPYSKSDSGVCTCFHARASHVAGGCTAQAIWEVSTGFSNQCPCKKYVPSPT